MDFDGAPALNITLVDCIAREFGSSVEIYDGGVDLLISVCNSRNRFEPN